MIVKRLRVFLEFVRRLLHYALHTREVIGTLLLLVALGGVAISWLERLTLSDGIYFAFITALSIGYGDISPQTMIGKVLSVGIGLAGMLFVGITVAISTRALADTARQHPDET